ncbi:hypothetical protein Q3G72_023398 [Acer saccharum]|nr:hypothetical protein Q3G72_023398 [Acer saccharum]
MKGVRLSSLNCAPLHYNDSSSSSWSSRCQSSSSSSWAAEAGVLLLRGLGYLLKGMRNLVNRPPTPDAVEEQEKEPTLQEIINIKLIESGEKEDNGGTV